MYTGSLNALGGYEEDVDDADSMKYSVIEMMMVNLAQACWRKSPEVKRIGIHVSSMYLLRIPIITQYPFVVRLMIDFEKVVIFS
jgi:hypothetical protein